MKKTSSLSTLPEQLSGRLAKLQSGRAIRVRKESHVDATEALEELNRLVDRLSLELTAASASRLTAAIDGWLKRQEKRGGGSVYLSDGTISGVGRLLLAATRIRSRSSGPDQPRRKRRTSRQAGGLVEMCLKTLVAASAHAECGVSWAHPVQYARSVCEITGRDFAELMSPEILGETFDNLLRGLTRALEGALGGGRTEEADSVVAALGFRGVLYHRLAEALHRLLRERAALLPISSQEWLTGFLRVAPEAGRVEHVRPSEAPEIRQAASLLLFLRDCAEDSPALGEAFQRFQSLCERHFGLVLPGEVGGIADYNGRVHEAKGAVSRKVRLIRPWVEWANPPRSSVVIRALVVDAQAPTTIEET